MKKFVIFHPDLVWSEGAPPCTLDEVASHIEPREQVLFAIVPSVGRAMGTERTIDSIVAAQHPGGNSFRIEPLETNAYQVYVAPDELLDRLRAMARDVSIVPYPAAVRQVVSAAQGEMALSLRERTRVFLQTITADLAKAAAPETLAIDSVGEDYLLTAVRGHEILAVRLLRGGDPVIEAHRTMASNRMDNPTILTWDEDLSLEFKSQGFTAHLLESKGPLVGLEGLDKALSLRFLTDAEVARARIQESRRKALLALGVSAAVAMAAGGALATMSVSNALAQSDLEKATAARDTQVARLATLYQERYATMARKESVQVSAELFDLSTSLPPQVVLLSVEKGPAGLSATVERRPGAAPFGRADLVSALAASPFFARAQVREEYEGHLVRYILNVPAIPAAPAP